MARRPLWRAWLAALLGGALMPAISPLSAAAQEPAPAPQAERPPGGEKAGAAEDFRTLLKRMKRVAFEEGNYLEAAAIAERLVAMDLRSYYYGAYQGSQEVARHGEAALDVARVFLRHGDFARAEPLLLQELAWFELHSPGEFLFTTFHALGELYLTIGDHPRSEQMLLRAEETLRRAGWQDSVLHHALLEMLTTLCLERGEYHRAGDLVTRLRGMSLYARAPQKPMPDLLLGELHLRRGYIEEAEPLLQQARTAIEAHHGEGSLMAARVLDDLGVLLTRKGDAGAEALLVRALEIRERQHTAVHPDIARSLDHLATFSLKQGKVADAVRNRARAAEVQDQGARILLSLGTERQKRAVMDRVQRDTDATVSLHLRAAPQDQAAARLALRSALRRKGLVLDAIASGFQALRGTLDAEGQALFDRIAGLDARLSTAKSRGPIDMPADEHRREMLALEAERQKLEAQLGARVRALPRSQTLGEPVTLERVQEAIPEGAALVEILEYQPYEPFGPPVRSTWGKARYAAYVLRRGGDVAAVDLGEVERIDPLAAALLPSLAVAGRDHRAAARRLDAAVMQPIRALLGETRWILLSPDGALNLVPFAALVDEHDRDLLESASFTYLTSGRDLLRASAAAVASAGAHEAAHEAAHDEGALVLADPAFGSATATAGDSDATRGLRSVDLAAVQFPPLPGTGKEAEAIRRTLANAKHAKRPTPATLLTGAAATEEALKGARPPRLLHIATHGFFLPDQGSGAAAPGEASRWTENPLLRAGLALAGANERRSTSDRNDGVLTALEISGLDLRGTRLVVLSACETGVGEVLPGEGVYGLRRALVLAGVETQVMSLWKVGDMATRDLMAAYYEELSRGGGRAEAMRAAQIAIRKDRPHPHSWASFIVSGNGAALDGAQVAPRFSSPPGAQPVTPGPRGCACATVGEERQGAPALAAAAFGAGGAALAARARARRRARRTRRHAT